MAFAIPSGLSRRESAAQRERVWFALAATVLYALLGLTLFLQRDLPMLDLPQHAVQVATWFRWTELPAADRAQLELNLRTPYLVAYALARTAMPWLGVVPALKLLVLLSSLGNLLALFALAKRTGHTPWLCLLGLPLTFGFAFYFGFVSFLFATPLVIFALALAFDHATIPHWRSGFALATLLCVILASHGFALVVSLSFVTPLLALGTGVRGRASSGLGQGTALGRVRSLLLRFAPLTAPLALGVCWLAPAIHQPALYDTTIRPARATRWLAMLFGAGSLRDGAAVALGLVFVVLVVLSVARVSRAPGRWVALLVVVLGYAFVPEMLWNTAFLHERFVVFLLPALMLASEPRRSDPELARPIAALALGTCAIWLLAFSSRVFQFNREMTDYHALTHALPMGLRIRPLIFAPESEAIPGAPVYLHVSAYYHAERGGIPAYSFAVQPSAVIRYKPGRGSSLNPGLEWAPERFDSAKDGERYDYFLVRATRERPDLFSGSRVPIVLDACRGNFCGYRPALSAAFDAPLATAASVHETSAPERGRAAQQNQR